MAVKQLVLLAFFVLLGSCPLLAQQNDSLANDSIEEDPDWVPTKPKPDKAYELKLGLKMGTQLSSLLGSEMRKSRLTFGVVGGAYARYNFPKGFSIQAETQISIRGSNFAYSDGEYSTIRLTYLDFPLIFFKSIDKKKVHRVGLGGQYSVMLSSSVYEGNINYPIGTPDLNTRDLAGLLAYQYHFSLIAIQVAAKYGFTNINLHNPWPNASGSNTQVKPFNTNGEIHNFAIEFNVIF